MADKRKASDDESGSPDGGCDSGKEWDWHIVLNRAHFHCDFPEGSSDIIPVSKTEEKYNQHCRITIGWMVSVYRLETDMFDGCEVGDKSKGFLPARSAKDIMDRFNISFNDDADAVKDCETSASLEKALSSPLETSGLLFGTKHLLVDAVDTRNLPKSAKSFISKALMVLVERKYMGVMGDGKDFMVRIHQRVDEDDWRSAVGERPKKIVLHVPLPSDVVPEKEVDEFTKQIHSAFPNARVESNRILTDDPARPVERLLWACDLTQQMKLRFMIRGEKPEDHPQNPTAPLSGNLGFGIDDFLRLGTPLKDFPGPKILKGAFYYASQLLAYKPWHVFAPFEILKVTVRKDCKETVRWVMFTGGDSQHKGSDTSNSAFGSIQIQSDISDLMDHFGRSSLYLQSGLFGSTDYTDRLYISTDPIGHAHYDTILLLKHLFGNSIAPLTSRDFSGTVDIVGGETILDFGIIPNMSVETGKPSGCLTEDKRGRGPGIRPFSREELDIMPKICYYCLKFAKEHQTLGIKPSGGSFTRTYRDDFSHFDSGNSVTVSYNMDQEFGGIWNAESKHMWFD